MGICHDACVELEGLFVLYKYWTDGRVFFHFSTKVKLRFIILPVVVLVPLTYADNVILLENKNLAELQHFKK